LDSIRAAGDLITALIMMGISTGWPPVAAGAFWVIVALWGIVSILFDDEVPRGIPGLEEINAYRERAEAKYQREHKG
jgi:hypothetical protein